MVSTRSNLLVILTDQQSADCMSHVAGSEYVRTPHLDALAAEGIRFDRAYCPHPLCVPSRASMFTGQYPHTTGILSNGDLKRDVSAYPRMGSLFRDAGFDTGYVGKWHLPWNQDDPTEHGFAYTANIRANGADPGMIQAASTFLDRERTDPFLLVVSFNNPHNICEWGRGNRRDTLPDAPIDEPPVLAHLPPLRPNAAHQQDEPDAITRLRRSYQASKTFPVGEFGEREWREYAWAYFRMVESVDQRVGALLAILENAGLRKNTALLFLSDHGDMQGAHHWNQKTTLYDESARVPLFLSCPGRTQAGVSNRLVNTGIDLIPTLCDIAGVNVPDDLPGRSVFDSGDPDYIVTETRFVQGAEIDGEIPQADGRMVRTERFKYCCFDQGEQRESLVDMEADPGEMMNRASHPEFADELARHRSLLKQFAGETGDLFPLPPA